MGFVAFLKRLGGHVKGAAIVVSDLFVKLVGKDKAEEFAHAAIGMLQSDLGVIVSDAVHAVQTLDPNASGDQKKTQAFEKIATDVKAKGIETSNSVISLLIELAVGVLKGHFAPAA